MQTEKLEPIYLEYALSSDDFRMKYMEKSSGSTVTGIRVRLLEQLTIPVPPMELQNQFATFVEQVDKSKIAVQKALDEAQTLFDSLMQEYFGWIKEVKVLNQKQLVEIIAIIRKMEIDNRVDLSDVEKELLKQFIDYVKDQIK